MANASDLTLIKIDGFPETSALLNWLVTAGEDGVGKKISLDNVKAELGIDALMQFGGAIAPASTPEPTGDFFWIATEEGTYTNFGGVVVPAASMAVISRIDGVFTSSITTIPQPENKIDDWVAGEYFEGNQRIHNGQIWSVDVASTTEEPGTGTDWIGDIDKVRYSTLEYESISKNRVLSRYVQAGRIDSAGNLNNTGNGEKSVIGLPMVSGDNTISGYIPSATKYIVFFDVNGVKISATTLSVVPRTFNVTGAVTANFTVKADDATEPDDSGWINSLQWEAGSEATSYTPGVEVISGMEGRQLGTSVVLANSSAPDPIDPENVANKKYIDENAIDYTSIRPVTELNSILNSNWTWSADDSGNVKVENLVDSWDAKLITGNTGFGFKLTSIRAWIVIGYSDANNICAVGISGGANIYGQVVNIDLANNSFSIVVAGSKPQMNLNDIGRVSINGDSIEMYKADVLSHTLSISSLVGLGANIDTVALGFAGFAATGLSSGDILIGEVGSREETTVKEALRRIETAGSSGKYASLENVSLSVLGDSIATSKYGGLVNGQIWWQLVAQWGGFQDAFANAVSGTPIAEKESFNSFVSDARWQSLNSDFEPNVIIIEGGTNDFGVRQVPLGTPDDPSTLKTTFYGALKYLLGNINTRYPTARIFFMTPLHQAGYGFPEKNNTTGFTQQQYVEAIREMCDLYGVTVIDMYQKSGLTYHNMNASLGLYSTDGIHPNAAGHRKMAEIVINAIADSFR